jgi:hypothetical protein
MLTGLHAYTRTRVALRHSPGDLCLAQVCDSRRPQEVQSRVSGLVALRVLGCGAQRLGFEPLVQNGSMHSAVHQRFLMRRRFVGVCLSVQMRRHGDEVARLAGGSYVARGRSDDTMNLGGIKVRASRTLVPSDQLVLQRPALIDR